MGQSVRIRWSDNECSQVSGLHFNPFLVSVIFLGRFKMKNKFYFFRRSWVSLNEDILHKYRSYKWCQCQWMENSRFFHQLQSTHAGNHVFRDFQKYFFFVKKIFLHKIRNKIQNPKKMKFYFSYFLSPLVLTVSGGLVVRRGPGCIVLQSVLQSVLHLCTTGPLATAVLHTTSVKAGFVIKLIQGWMISLFSLE